MLVMLATALAYGVIGKVSIGLAVGPGFAAPLYPPAGIALVCALVYGRWGVLGALLGGFWVNWPLHAPLEQLPAGLAVGAMLGVGAALQALAGAEMVRRFVRQPLTLSEPRDIAAFFGFGAIAASLISGTISTSTLAIAGIVTQPDAWRHWMTWCLGDALGALVASPIVLTMIGQPRADWAARRATVGLTMTAATVLTATMIFVVARWDEDRLRANFEREAFGASSALAFQLQEPLHALEALHGVYVSSEDVTADELRRATKAWLTDEPGHIQAMGFSQLLRRDKIPALEAAMHAEGFGQYKVFDRGNGPAGDTVVALRYIEPHARNAAALGVNALSIPAARTAIEAAIRTDKPAASAGFALTQDTAGADRAGVVIYQAVYTGHPTTAQERVAAAHGVVFVTLRIDDTLRSVLDQIPHYLTACIVDTDPLAARRRLSGPPGCETRNASLLHVRPLAFAGRQWDLRIFADVGALPGASQGNAWPFSIVALMSTALLGALLLTVTGRAQRIELAVRERTAALTRQVREREQAEAAMRASEQRFRNIFNNVPIGICYTDLRGNVKQTNARFCEMTGYSPEELLTMTADDFTHPDDVAQDREFSAQLVRGELAVYRRHKRYLSKSSRTVWVQSTVSLLRNEDGRPWRIVGAVEDITEHLRLQEAERAREAAEASNRAKSDFLSRMSHELRTPLNAMLGFAQLIELDQRNPIAQTQRAWVGQIQQAGWHLLEMINDVLDLSRIESGNLRLTMEPLDLRSLLDATLTMVQSDAARRGISIRQDLANNAVSLRGDATRIKQILTNLLTNAVKYNRDGGQIVVSSRRDAETVEITVTDTGLGMTAQQMGELFQPFNRLGRERSTQEGTGIGLVISQRLAELMGGTLRARSVAGEGSAFVVRMPAVQGPQPSRSQVVDFPDTNAEYHRRIVHYVEDNETNVEVMRGILAQRPQVLMDVSVTGLDGLAAIRARRPDVILLDMHLPDISGMELLRHLKADPDTADVPVIIVSADALVAQIEAAREAGAMHYLTKPISVSELLGVLDELLDQVETRFG